MEREKERRGTPYVNIWSQEHISTSKLTFSMRCSSRIAARKILGNSEQWSRPCDFSSEIPLRFVEASRLGDGVHRISLGEGKINGLEGEGKERILEEGEGGGKKAYCFFVLVVGFEVYIVIWQGFVWRLLSARS